MFNAIDYLKKIASANSLAKANEFFIGECSGIEGLEPLMQNYRKEANYIMVDDTVDGSMISNRVGWYNRRTYTVFIFAMYREDDMERRRAAKSQAGEFAYEGRVVQSHMSMERAMEWLDRNADPDRSRIVFLHGHVEKGEVENGVATASPRVERT